MRHTERNGTERNGTNPNSLRAADKTEELVSLLEKVLGHTDAHAEEVKSRAKVRPSRQLNTEIKKGLLSFLGRRHDMT